LKVETDYDIVLGPEISGEKARAKT